MSSFIIYRKKEYAVILADSMGQREFAGGNKAPLLAPKLTHVAPWVFATHTGVWQMPFSVLSRLHDFLMASPQPRTYEAICEFLEETCKERYEYYKELWKREHISVRLPVLLTGPYRSPADQEKGASSSLLLCETANQFVPKPASGGWYAANAEVTAVVTEVIKLPALEFMLNSGPLSLAQALDAIHALVSKLTTSVSVEPNIVIVGEGEEYTLVKGNMTRLPMDALKYG